MRPDRFEERWRVLVAVARRAPVPTFGEPAPHLARLPARQSPKPRVRLAVAACAALYLAAAPLLERAVAAPLDLAIALPSPPSVPPPPVARPPALPQPPRPPLTRTDLESLLSWLVPSPKVENHDPR